MNVLGECERYHALIVSIWLDHEHSKKLLTFVGCLWIMSDSRNNRNSGLMDCERFKRWI